MTTIRQSNQPHGRQRGPSGRSLWVAVGLLALLTLVLAACGAPKATAPASAVPAASTVTDLAPSPTTEVAMAPTATGQPAAPTDAPAKPTAVPTEGTIQPTATVESPTATAVPVVPSVTPAPSPSPISGEAQVEMEDMQFRPKVLTIRVGTTVKFGNRDAVQHTATSDTEVFDSGNLSKGQEFFFTFTEAGTYPYYCTLHGGKGGAGMSATIIVVP